MATRQTVTLTDDIDGKPAVTTIRFSLDGQSHDASLSSDGLKSATYLK